MQKCICRAKAKVHDFTPKSWGLASDFIGSYSNEKLWWGILQQMFWSFGPLLPESAFSIFSSKKNKKIKIGQNTYQRFVFFSLPVGSMESKASKVQLIDLCSSNKIGVDINNWMIIALKYWSTGKSTGG